MLAFDASSIIHAWDNYPEKNFPPLWNWICNGIDCGEYLMSQVAFEEVKRKTPDCAKCLGYAGLQPITVCNATAQEAVRIKGRLGIANEEYHPDGVGENDILIIATAKIWSLELVSEERRQATQPRENRRLKIPRVCELPDVGVKCINFIDLIRRSNEVFR
jgi:hypothetical protein